MSHSVKVTLIGDSQFEFDGKQINIHDVDSVTLTDGGEIKEIHTRPCEYCGRGGGCIERDSRPERPKRYTVTPYAQVNEYSSGNYVRWADVKHLFRR
jgi:hypothetical protein